MGSEGGEGEGEGKRGDLKGGVFNSPLYFLMTAVTALMSIAPTLTSSNTN